jgi:hypothetical protein
MSDEDIMEMLESYIEVHLRDDERNRKLAMEWLQKRDAAFKACVNIGAFEL